MSVSTYRVLEENFDNEYDWRLDSFNSGCHDVLAPPEVVAL